MTLQNSSLPRGATIALLDPLRALCAILVIAWHLSEHTPFVLPIFSSAAFAVDIFMIISGFLMTYHFYMREEKEPWNSRSTIVRFYTRRFFRIAPLYYVLVLLVFVWREPGNWLWLFFRVTFLFGFIQDNEELTRCPMPDWSIALEMQFYLAFPFLMLLIRKIGFGAFFCLSSLSAAISFQLFSYYSTTPPGLFGNFTQPTLLPHKLHIFAIGMVAAGVLIQGRSILISKWYLPGFVFLALTCHFNYTKLMGAGYLLLYVLLLMPSAYEWIGALVGKLNDVFARRKWLCYPAEFTYSAYLIHNLVFMVGLDWFIETTGIVGEGVFEYSLLLMATLITVGAVSAILLYLVERPGIAYGKKLIRSRVLG